MEAVERKARLRQMVETANVDRPKLRVEKLTLLDAGGAQTASVPNDGRLDVLVEWSADAGQTVTLTLELRKDGAPLFTTTADAGTGTSGRARLSIPRVGLGEGAYEVRASAGEDAQTAPLTITAHAPGTGLVRPAHVWSLDTTPARATS